MGNAPSSEEARTRLDNENYSSPRHLTQSPPQDRSIRAVHPLLNPITPSKSTPVSSASEVMAQQQQPEDGPFSKRQDNSVSTPDVTMSGTGQSNVNLTSAPSAMNIDQDPEQPQQQMRRRSTLILTDEPEFEKLTKLTKTEDVEATQEHESLETVEKMQPNEGTPDAPAENIQVEINWFQGGENVFITGSFTGWRKMIKLNKESDEKFGIKLKLPVGTHRFRFIVDNQLRFSDYLPTATDQMGNFVNYIEIQSPVDSQVNIDQKEELKPATKKDSNLGLTNDDDDMGNGYSRFHEQPLSRSKEDYIRDIRAIFTDPGVMEQYYATLDSNQNQNQAWLTPPQLPPHLESVILNNYSNADKSNSGGALPIPNHVVLNHLATTSIKHNTLAVASVVRYKRKYVTQLLYAPLQ